MKPREPSKNFLCLANSPLCSGITPSSLFVRHSLFVLDITPAKKIFLTYWSATRDGLLSPLFALEAKSNAAALLKTFFLLVRLVKKIDISNRAFPLAEASSERVGHLKNSRLRGLKKRAVSSLIYKDRISRIRATTAQQPRRASCATARIPLSAFHLRQISPRKHRATSDFLRASVCSSCLVFL